MTCRELVDFLLQYLDGELPAARRAAFERHLSACRDCRAYLATYADTIRLGKAACADPGGAMPAGVPEELVRAVLAARALRG
jgi:anti-sigma factor RsiW